MNSKDEINNILIKRDNKTVNTNIIFNFLTNPFMKTMYIFIIGILITWGTYKLLKYEDEINYPHGKYEMTYRVYYTPNNIKEYTIQHNRPIIVHSNRGSNTIKKYDGAEVISTNAPIEIVKYVKNK